MEHEILDLIDRYWKFDNDQTPVSNWHDKQDLLEAVRKALRIHDVSSSGCPCNELPNGEIAISSKALQNPYGDFGQTDC
jgi:hypothetical protein